MTHAGMAEWTVDAKGVITPRSYYERALATGAPPDVIAGLDLLVDDGMDLDKAVDLLAAAHRGGHDAEHFARHLLTLRKAFND